MPRVLPGGARPEGETHFRVEAAQVLGSRGPKHAIEIGASVAGHRYGARAATIWSGRISTQPGRLNDPIRPGVSAKPLRERVKNRTSRSTLTPK
jgi:hypothetical protein